MSPIMHPIRYNKAWNRNNPIAQFIRKRRKDLNLTQVELLNTTGVGLER